MEKKKIKIKMKTNLKVDRKQMGSKSYAQNAKGWTTELRKGNMPQYPGCSYY